MSNIPLVSICCLAFNHAQFIKFALDSIANLDYRNIEVIILDDGSTDNTYDVLNEYVEKFVFPIKLIRQDNTGYTGANFNKTLKFANGKYISFLSLDDALFPNAISQKVELMEKDEKIEYIFNTQIQYMDQNDKPYNTLKHVPIDLIEELTNDDILKLECNYLHSYFIQGALYKKSLIDSIGGFDNDIIADDIVLRTKIALWMNNPENSDKKFVALKNKSCFYRRHKNNTSDCVPRHIRLVMEYFNRYHCGKKIPKLIFELYFKLILTFSFREFFILAFRYNLKYLIFRLPLWVLRAFFLHFKTFVKKCIKKILERGFSTLYIERKERLGKM